MKLALALVTCLFLLPAASLANLPETAVETVADAYHGVEVVDGYRWLEDWSNARVQEWSEAQNRHAREYLDALPSGDDVRARVSEIMEAPAPIYGSLTWREGRLFVVMTQPPKQQRFLAVMPSAAGLEEARVLVDPNTMDPTGATAIDWYVPSPDGELVAVSLSVGGSESGDVHIYRTATGEAVGDVIPRVNGGTAGGDVAWLPDASGFLYTRYPRSGERRLEDDMNFFQQIYLHKLGTPSEKDVYELGRKFPRIAEIALEADHDSGWTLATLQYGDSGRFQIYARSPEGKWAQLTEYKDQIVQATFGPDGMIYMISRDGAPRGAIRRMSVAKPDLAAAETIVPEGDDAIVSDFYYGQTMVVDGRIYVTYQLGGPSELRVFDLEGVSQEKPRQPSVSATGHPIPVGDGDILFSSTSYLEPQAWYRFDPESRTTVKTALATPSSVDFSDTEVVREWAVSKDGTRVPVNIIRPKGIALDGSHPVLLTGYGGYGVNREPRFYAVRRVWIEQGGVYADANIRGGGEFGEEWHREGMLTKKQNCFDDFAAVMQHMIDAGYTTSERLAIMGGSNGGLLMGAMITQHPELARTVVSFTGVYDMLRVELSPNGKFNIPEYGTVEDPEQFKALHMYSPYHRVEPGTRYPSILLMTGANDPRVDPMQSRKMTAHLQAATSSGAPVLLRTSSNTGHGLDTPLAEQIGEMADFYSFVFKHVGVEYKPGRAD